jgi:SSS family solute:Na+ symporter
LIVPAFQSLSRNPELTRRTQPREVEISAAATAEDVAAGRASAINQTIRKTHIVAPVGCFFETVARVDPKDETKGYEGLGRFFAENYVLYRLGLPIDRFSPAGIVATRWLFDTTFPFVCLICFSLITKPDRSPRADRFYAKMKTPIAPTALEDQAEVERSFATPQRFDDTKLFPQSNWEFTRWTRRDVVGFFGCWGIVGLILMFLWIVLRLGA